MLSAAVQTALQIGFDPVLESGHPLRHLLQRAVEHLADLMLQHHQFLLGDAPVYADYALLGIVGNLTYRGINQLPSRLKALRAWRTRIEAYRFAG